MKTHHLKIAQVYAERLADRTKTCEIRLNDRDFQNGDKIVFEVISNNLPSPFYLPDYEITHVLTDYTGLEKGFCVLSIHPAKTPSVNVDL